jgi:hypothetical protein
MKPNYLVIGAAKCATTTIRSLIGRHPDVFMVRNELQFFNHDQVFARGFDWYESHYEAAGDRPLRGEGCNGCTMQMRYPHALERLSAYAPDLKLIYVVRNPFERIQSFWIELRSQHPDYVHHDFNKAVDVNRDWFVDPSNYLAQIEPYRRAYGHAAIQIVFYEDFCRAPEATLKTCFTFLGVDPHVDVGASTARLNESDKKAVASALLSRIRSIPGYRRVARQLPRPWRERVARRSLFRKLRQRPAWRPATRAWVSDVLKDDLQAFLSQNGKRTDFWNLDAPMIHDGIAAGIHVAPTELRMSSGALPEMSEPILGLAVNRL